VKKRFVTALSRISPNYIKLEVNRDISRDKEFVKYARALCKQYNKGIKANKLKVSKLED